MAMLMLYSLFCAVKVCPSVRSALQHQAAATVQLHPSMRFGDLQQQARATAAAAAAAKRALEIAEDQIAQEEESEAAVATRLAIQALQKIDDINDNIARGTALTRKETSLALAVKHLPGLAALDTRPDLSAPSLRAALPSKDHFVDLSRKKPKKKRDSSSSSTSSSSTSDSSSDDDSDDDYSAVEEADFSDAADLEEECGRPALLKTSRS